jgi:MoxR-like ATPase
MVHRELEDKVQEIADARGAIQEAVGAYVVGHGDLVDLIVMGILTSGHVLVDGVPGTAKTTISKLVARLVGYRYNRVQGVVDVQPADILGVRIYNADRHEFVLQKGPIFTNFMLIDEINRLTPRTQSAFIEAMAETQATIDGINYPLENPFFVIATQNTQELEGTFPLIEAQRDRFMFSTTLSHLDRESEVELLRRKRDGNLAWDEYWQKVTPVLSSGRVRTLSRYVNEVFVSDTILNYIRDIVIASREHRDVRMGCSSRGSLALLLGARAAAAIEGRTYVIPDDVQRMTEPVIGHRLILDQESAIDWVSVDHVVNEILETIEVA